MSVITAERPRSRLAAGTTRTSILLFLLPALALYVIFVILPVFQAAYFSVFDWNIWEAPTKFVGIDNYTRALNEDWFRGAVFNNITIVVLSLTIQIPIALALAVYLNQRFPGRTLFRVIFFLPYVISEVVTGIVFYLLVQPDGMINASLRSAGLGGLTENWLSDVGTSYGIFVGPVDVGISLVMVTLFIIISWKYFGFHMIILLAGLQGIPREIREAALIDGANRWQAFRHITLPLLGPTLRVSIFLSVIGALQLFDIVYATTRGGPVHTSDTMAYYMFDFGFKRQEMGYGCAVAVILLLICFSFALAYQRFVLSRDVEGAVTTYEGE
jgi:raffinose/stachyose/melibiose transport system permease protein